MMTAAPLTLSHKAQRTPDSPISFFMEQALKYRDLISLAAGFVDTASLPVGPIAGALADIMSDPATARTALQYGTTQGLPSLRKRLAEHLAGLDGTDQPGFTADDIVVTTGSQQLLYMMSEALLDPGDIVITESPSYFVYHGVLAGNGVRVLTVPMDEDGMMVDELQQLLEQLDRAGELCRVKLIYTVDYFQNPTGLTLSRIRREELVAVVRSYADRTRILILEDAAYRELRYEGEELPSLKSYDPENSVVIYAGTFSKPCAPGLKTGYAVMPRELVSTIVRLKGSHDFGSGNLAQVVLDRVLANGDYANHVQYLRSVYRAKRNAMVEALETEFGDLPGAGWTHPLGGMFIWLTLPAEIRTSTNSPFMRAALEAGVMYIPGEFGHASEDGDVPKHEIRLSFGDASPEQIREGVARLRRAADRVLQGSVEAVPAGSR